MRVLAALAAVLLASPVWAATTRTSTIYLPAAGCRDTTPGSFFSLQTTTPPGVECISEREGVLAYADAANEGAVTSFRLPATWVSANGINASIAWRTNTDTGAVGWCVELVCTADNESINPGFPGLGAGNCVSDTAAAGPDNVNFAAITGVTATGCLAGEIVWVRVSRDGAGTIVTDSVTQDADLIGLELTMVDTGVTLESAATGVLGGVQLDDDLGGTAASPDVVDVTCSGSCISDAEVDAAITVDWTGLQTYPTGCTNQFVRTIGDTLTCADVTLTTDTAGNYVATITGGAGIASTGATTGEGIAHTLSTASSEADFLTSGALTCGASAQGKAQVHTTPLQYCDNAATPTLRYAAYADSSGNATSGDSATSFFSTGTVEADRLPKGDDDAATLGIVTLADEEFDCTTGSCVLAAASIDGGTAGEIADASITAADLATDSVAADEIATSAVGAAEVNDNTLTASDLADSLDFSADTSFAIPTPAGGNPTVDGTGEVAIDTTNNQLLAYGAALTVHDPTKASCINIANPTSSDFPLMLKAPRGITVSQINCLSIDGTSAVVEVMECDANGANCTGGGLDGGNTITCLTTNTTDDGTLSNPGVDSGDWIRVDVGTVTDAVTQLAVCLTYTVTRT